MAHATRPVPRYATWLIEGADSPTDRAVSNPASLGYGADLAGAMRNGEPRVKVVYLLPTFQTPSGVSLTRERRKRLLEIAREHDLLIIEDDPYGEFWFDHGTEPVPPLRSLPGAEDHVVYL